MNSKKLRMALIACGMIAAAGPAWALTATTTFNVTGSVVGVCMVSVSNLSFGATIPAIITSNIDVSVNMSVTCASGTAYSVALSAGGGSGASFATRKLTSGANTMDYTLYTESGRTTVWGDGSGGSQIIQGTGTGVAQSIPVYGRIAPQSVAVGAYTDTITVTMTY